MTQEQRAEQVLENHFGSDYDKLKETVYLPRLIAAMLEFSASPYLLKFSDLIYEQDLPEMSDEEYKEWYRKSCVVDGVRMGPPLQPASPSPAGVGEAEISARDFLLQKHAPEVSELGWFDAISISYLSELMAEWLQSQPSQPLREQVEQTIKRDGGDK